MRFHFVDRIERIVKNRSASGVKVVSFEEGFLLAPYPRSGEFPRLLLLEAAAQLGSWLIVYSSDFTKIPLLAKMERVEISEGVFCGDRLRIEVEMIGFDAEGALLQAAVYKSDRPIARGRNCLCTLVGLERLADSGLMRSAFKELTKNAIIG